jgi:hypothetical protein
VREGRTHSNVLASHARIQESSDPRDTRLEQRNGAA